MKAFLIGLLSKFGKGMLGKLLRKAIPILVLLSVYLVAGIILKVLWKKFKKQFIPFVK